MDRAEQVVRHGDFRVVATAEKARAQRDDDAKWEVLVSLWKANADPASATPEIMSFRDRQSLDFHEALSSAVAAAVRQIDERGK